MNQPYDQNQSNHQNQPYQQQSYQQQSELDGNYQINQSPYPPLGQGWEFRRGPYMVPIKEQKKIEHHKAMFVIFLVLSSIQLIPFGLLVGIIMLMNMICGGTSCDGNPYVCWSPKEDPIFFLGLFLWMLEIIALFVIAIIHRVKQKEIQSEIEQNR